MSKSNLYHIKDFGEIITGSTPSTNNSSYWDGEYNFYSPADFTDNVFCVNTEKKISKEGLKQGREISKNSILVTCIASIGKIAISGRDGITNQQINAVVTNEKFDFKYIYYLLAHNTYKIKGLSAQTTIPIINKTDFGKVQIIALNNKSDQQKIAHILTTSDIVIEQTQSAIAKYKAIKQGMLHDLFTRGLDANGHLRPCHNEAPALYKESELGMIPKEWEVKRLEEISTKIGDGIHTTPHFTDSSDYYFINGNNLVNGIINITSKTNSVSLEEYHKYKIDLNNYTILMSINGTIGNLAYYRNEKVILGKSAAYICCVNDVEVDYIYHLLGTNQKIKYFTDELTGSTIKNLSLTSIRKAPVQIPRAAEQKLIVKRLSTLDNKLHSEEALLQKYQSIKRGLMGDLLGGRTTVVDDCDAFAM